MKYVLIAFLVMLGTTPVHACLWAGGQNQSLFSALPGDATSHDINAEVRVISTEVGADNKRRSDVTVIKPLKGVNMADTLTVISETSSCAIDYDVKAGNTYFIAGERDAQGRFYGSWNGLGEFIPKK